MCATWTDSSVRAVSMRLRKSTVPVVQSSRTIGSRPPAGSPDLGTPLLCLLEDVSQSEPLRRIAGADDWHGPEQEHHEGDAHGGSCPRAVAR